MFVLKNKYYFIIENTKDIDLSNIKICKKINIIYRKRKFTEKISNLLRFRRFCLSKRIKFYISNDLNLLKKIKADGLYISANNKNLSLNILKNANFDIIGSAHNYKEINIKKIQGCSTILFSRLFKTTYLNKKDFLGLVRFNFISLNQKLSLVPLGGIRLSNLNKLNIVKCNSFAVLSEIKKKPANIINRLF
tara:strand:- start:229 stop:804 length:576 start_codon:yes stop_codon:yes gene_type:complete